MKTTVTILARNDTGLKQSNSGENGECGPESEKERQVGRRGDSKM